MNAQPAIRRRIGVGLVGVLATLLSSACATGQQAQTAHEVPAIDATSGSVGSIQLHEVAIKPPSGPAYAAGDSAELQLVVVNTGHVADTLQSVSTPAASVSQAFASPADASAAASPHAGPSASASSSAAPLSAPSLAIAGGQALSLGVTGTDAVLLLLALTKTLFTGTTVPITFTFAKAGPVTLTVPVQISDNASPPGISIPPLSSGSTP